jgi:hypothetical protein
MVIFPGIIELPGRIAAVGWPARPLRLAHSKALNSKALNSKALNFKALN